MQTDIYFHPAGDDDQGPSGSKGLEKKGKPLTAKQVEAKLKREAAQVSKDQARADKRAESERKKAAKQQTKNVVSLSSKLSAPLATCLHKMNEVLDKAFKFGVESDPKVQELKDKTAIVEDWKKNTVAALAFYSKNPTCELGTLPFETDKEVFTYMKDLMKLSQEVTKLVITPAKSKK